MAEDYRQRNISDHLISQKVRSFGTFSKLLETLQFETALSYTCGVHIFKL